MRRLLNMGNGYKLKYLKRILDLIMMGFQNDSSELFIHAVCFFRALKKGKLLFTSSDLYRPKSEGNEPFDWTSPGATIFDKCVEKHNSILNELILLKIQTKGKDLELTFEKGIKFQMLIDITEEEEKIRVFSDNEEILVIYS